VTNQTPDWAVVFFWRLVVFVPFGIFTIRTRKDYDQRVDEIDYRLFGQRGLFVWFQLNAPGVMLHEMSHAIKFCSLRPLASVSWYRNTIKYMKNHLIDITSGADNRSSSARCNMAPSGPHYRLYW